MIFQISLRPCALDESSLSIGRVKVCLLADSLAVHAEEALWAGFVAVHAPPPCFTGTRPADVITEGAVLALTSLSAAGAVRAVYTP